MTCPPCAQTSSTFPTSGPLPKLPFLPCEHRATLQVSATSTLRMPVPVRCTRALHPAPAAAHVLPCCALWAHYTPGALAPGRMLLCPRALVPHHTLVLRHLCLMLLSAALSGPSITSLALDCAAFPIGTLLLCASSSHTHVHDPMGTHVRMYSCMRSVPPVHGCIGRFSWMQPLSCCIVLLACAAGAEAGHWAVNSHEWNYQATKRNRHHWRTRAQPRTHTYALFSTVHCAIPAWPNSNLISVTTVASFPGQSMHQSLSTLGAAGHATSRGGCLARGPEHHISHVGDVVCLGSCWG